MTPVSYLILTLTAVASHLIANHRLLFLREQLVEPRVNRALRSYLFVVLLFYCVDASWALMRLLGSPGGLVLVTEAFFLGLFWIVVFGIRFSISYASHRDWSRRITVGISAVAATICLASLVLNLFTPFFFTIDDSCGYTPGFWRTITLLLYAVGYLTGAVMVMFDGVRSQVEARRRVRTVFAYRLTMALAIGANILFPGISLRHVGLSVRHGVYQHLCS